MNITTFISNIYLLLTQGIQNTQIKLIEKPYLDTKCPETMVIKAVLKIDETEFIFMHA